MNPEWADAVYLDDVALCDREVMHPFGQDDVGTGRHITDGATWSFAGPRLRRPGRDKVAIASAKLGRWTSPAGYSSCGGGSPEADGDESDHNSTESHASSCAPSRWCSSRDRRVLEREAQLCNLLARVARHERVVLSGTISPPRGRAAGRSRIRADARMMRPRFGCARPSSRKCSADDARRCSS
jgi:hypothetical protein